MQKEYLIETRSVTDEKGNLLHLKYYLIEEERPVSPAPLYRICIKKSLTEYPGVEEAESTPPVSASESRPGNAPKSNKECSDARMSSGNRGRYDVSGERTGFLKGSNMSETYRFAYEGGVGELVEKKSRFIATVTPVTSEEEALRFIEQTKKKYWDARHNCTAFTIGSRHQLTRCSDDGEPAGTAGRPMLDVLLKEDIHNVAVVVTRYFGGTLLGTGGLVRAYSGAVQEGLRSFRDSYPSVRRTTGDPHRLHRSG